MAVLNNPFDGGTHLPDITLVAPVFAQRGTPGPSFYAANRAHHADVGGMTSGLHAAVLLDSSRRGLIIPPVQAWCARGEH